MRSLLKKTLLDFNKTTKSTHNVLIRFKLQESEYGVLFFFCESSCSMPIFEEQFLHIMNNLTEMELKLQKVKEKISLARIRFV